MIKDDMDPSFKFSWVSCNWSIVGLWSFNRDGEGNRVKKKEDGRIRQLKSELASLLSKPILPAGTSGKFLTSGIIPGFANVLIKNQQQQQGNVPLMFLFETLFKLWLICIFYLSYFIKCVNRSAWSFASGCSRERLGVSDAKAQKIKKINPTKNRKKHKKWTRSTLPPTISVLGSETAQLSFPF